jgi:hypothetical protein
LEFQATQSGALTPAEFEMVNLEEQADPPAFIQAQQKEVSAVARQMDSVLQKFRRMQDTKTSEDELDALDEAEIQAYILDDEESSQRSKVWMAEHGDYVKAMEEREAEKLVKQKHQQQQQGTMGGKVPKVLPFAIVVICGTCLSFLCRSETKTK